MGFWSRVHSWVGSRGWSGLVVGGGDLAGDIGGGGWNLVAVGTGWGVGLRIWVLLFGSNWLWQ